MALTQDQIQVAQGALYLIDHIGRPPLDMKFRQFTEQAMKDHLKQHTYHYRPAKPTGPSNRNRVTLVWMRRATFSEADLPGYEGRAGLADDDEEDAVKEHEIIKTNVTKPESRKRVRDSSVHSVSSKRLRTGATHIASPSSSQKSLRTSADNDQAELYLQAQASANLLTRVKPTTAQTTTSEEEESALKVQSPERRGGGLLKRQAPYPAATPTAATKPVPLPLPSATQDSNAPQAPSRNALENVLSQIKRRNGSNPEQTESKQPSVRALIESGKGKRGDEDLDDAIEDEVAIKPAECKKSKTSIKIGPSVRHPQVVIPGASSPLVASSQPTLDTSTALEADIMQGVEHASDVRSVENGIRGSQPSQPAVSSQHAEQQLQPAPFDYEQQGRDFGGFYSRIERATDRVIDSIGRSISDFLSPMDESPSERLEALYKRCLGPDWEAVRVQLTRDKTFTAHDVAMSVISAFLFENVLNQQASIEDIRAKLLELDGTMGRAILRTLNLDSNEHDLTEIARTIESEDARIKLAEGEKSGTLQHQLHVEAQKFAKELWEIIVPHFRSLSTFARGYGMSSQRPEQAWHDAFDRHFVELIQEILHYRLGLLATGCEHAYTWAANSEEYDVKFMRSQGGAVKLPTRVWFTLFPGAKVRPLGARRNISDEGMKAVVAFEKVKDKKGKDA